MTARRYDDLSDEKLAGLAQDGDRRAMKVIVTRYEPLRAGELRTWGMPLRDYPDIIDDLASSILLATIKLIHAWKPSKGVRVAGWLKECLWRDARDAAAKHLKEVDPINDGGDMDAEPPDDSPDTPDSRLRYREIIDGMHDALDPLYFEIFYLWHWDYKYSEIAETLGIGTSAVRNAINRRIKPAGEKVLTYLGYEP